MSLKCMNWVWHESTVGGTDRLVLLALADEADDDGGSCYPSIRRLAAKCRIHTSTVVGVIERLERAGAISVERPEVKGRGRFNRYQLLMNARNPDHSENARVDLPEPPVNARECAPLDPRIPTDPTTTDPRPSGSADAKRRPSGRQEPQPSPVDGMAAAAAKQMRENMERIAAEADEPAAPMPEHLRRAGRVG